MGGCRGSGDDCGKICINTTPLSDVRGKHTQGYNRQLKPSLSFLHQQTQSVRLFSLCVSVLNTITSVGLRFSQIIYTSSSLKESASVIRHARCRVCFDLVCMTYVYLWSSPSLSSVSESLLAWCSFMRSTSSFHTNQSSQIFTRCRYLTVSWGNGASRHRLLSTGTHTSPDGSFCIRIIQLFRNGWQNNSIRNIV